MKHMVVSCHAETNGNTFTHGRLLTIYYFQYDTLHDPLASKTLKRLRKVSPSMNSVAAHWNTLAQNGIAAQVLTYPAHTPIPDYHLWDLDAKWSDVSGIFSFENFIHRYFLSDKKNDDYLLSKLIDKDTDTLIWLACTA